MSRFIKLTYTIINTSHIKKIMIEPNKYCLHLSDQYIYSSDCKIEICKMKNITDYVIMNTWIDNLNKPVSSFKITN